MFKRENGQRPVDGDWHAGRENARRTAFSLAEFSEQEIERLDLETAGVNGEDNPRSYEWKRPLWPSKKVDVREFPRW